MADENGHWSEQSIQPDFQQAASPEQEQTAKTIGEGHGTATENKFEPVPVQILTPDGQIAEEVNRTAHYERLERVRQTATQTQQQAAHEAEMKAPERSISDDFNFKADELERVKRDAENTQERVETLKGYARPVNQAEQAMDDLEEDEDMSF